MEREKFEESWKRAFEGAEISPSDRVWTNIELDLEKARGGDLKRRLLFYQMLAAASVVFAMAIGGVGYYYTFNADRSTAGMLAQNDQRERVSPSAPAESDEETSTQAATTPAVRETPQVAGSQGPGQESDRGSANRKTNDTYTYSDAAADRIALAQDNTEHKNRGEGSPIVSSEENHVQSGLPRQLDERELPPLYAARKVTLNFHDKEQQPEVDPVVKMLADLERREMEVRDKKDEKDVRAAEHLWTSIGFAAGAFNTVRGPSASGSSGAAFSALAAPIVENESKASGYSYSVGVNLGTRLAERWVLQGGVNYLTHASTYTANNVVVDGLSSMSGERFKPAASNAVVGANSEYDLSNRIMYSAPYDVNNNMRYLSIPLQAGYLLIDKTFGLQFNAGVATDLFLQNTVEGEGDQLARTTQSGGDASPYRTVNLSGLVGTELSYRFGPHYRVSLNPGIRYPFNTIYKSELGVESSPLTFDVGLRFRYIFH